MVRLYVDKKFESGAQISLPESELRYLKTVRRGQGEVRLFNQWGQEAEGILKDKKFVITQIHLIERPVWGLTVGVGLPENTVIPEVIRSVSELGAQALFFFESHRTQSFKKRVSLERWRRLAIEASRQCERPQPLEILEVDWKDPEFLARFSSKFLFDEAPRDEGLRIRSDPKAQVLAVFGSEGGWTEAERAEAQTLGYTFLHIDLPVLRVGTAVTCLSFYLLDRFFLKNP